MQKRGLLIIMVLLVLAGCDDPSGTDSVEYPYLSGVWDFTLTPTVEAEKTYDITVEKSGGSGVAEVSIWGPDVSGSSTVVADQEIEVACGAYIVFGDTAGFWLSGGDSWSMRVSEEIISRPVPGNTVDSTVGEVYSGGTYNCGEAACAGSALASAVPYPTKGIGQEERRGGQWLSVRLSQDGPNVNSTIPEQHALTLYLGTISAPSSPLGIATGDSVTVSYRRRLSADGEDGDFFRVLITSGTSYYEPEYVYGPDMESSATVTSYTFPASPETQVDFTAGLSGLDEYVILDSVEVSTGSTVLFSEDFESGYAGLCSPEFDAGSRWQGRYPAWRKGDFCISARNALEGSYSAYWRGGSYRPLTGSIISGGSMAGLASFIGGGLFGGSSASELEGLFMEVWEPVYTGHMTVFSAAEQSPGNLAGTFRGESQETGCLEEGRLTASRQRSEEADLSASYWVIRIDGQAVNCEPAAGSTILFGDTLSTSTGDTVRVVQLGGYFLAAEDAVDDYGNAYGINGLVSGTLVNMVMENEPQETTANGTGALSEDSIQGVLTGSLVFDSGRVCELAEQSTFRVTLLPKQ
ncbi:MAG: hypothetical protein R6V10_07730 [bacterium]